MITRRQALIGLSALLAADTRGGGRLYRRLGVAFGVTVSLTVRAEDEAQAEMAFAAAFAEIRAVDLMSSLTDPRGELFRLNLAGRLERPSGGLRQLLETAALMHEATGGLFDATIQPLWRATDDARGRLSADGLARALALVDASALVFDARSAGFTRPGMAATLNSLSRGLAADRVAEALRRQGVTQAMFDTDVLGAIGPWKARVRNPRAESSIAVARVQGFLATSGDYQYHWTPDYALNHILDPRRGDSPRDFASVTVQADTGLLADALSTAVFLSGAAAAPALLARFKAEALFVGKDGKTAWTSGFPIVS